MNGEFVKELEEIILRSSIVVESGELFSSQNLKKVYHDPRPETVVVRTLTSLLDYLETKGCESTWDAHPMFISVANERTVEVYTEPYGIINKHHLIAQARTERPGFDYGSWFSTDMFIIKLLSLFEHSPDMEILMAYAGTMTLNNGLKVEDDGVTQRTNVKVGISGGLTESQPAPGRVTLTPFRTFTEIEQPSSDFVFRVKVSGEEIKCALFEADGGAWKNEAQASIKTWLVEHETPLPVIA